MLAPRGFTGSACKSDRRSAKSIAAPRADIRLGTSFPSGPLSRIVLAFRGVTDTSQMPRGRQHNTVSGLRRTGHRALLRTFPTSEGPKPSIPISAHSQSFVSATESADDASPPQGQGIARIEGGEGRLVKRASLPTPTQATTFPAGFPRIVLAPELPVSMLIDLPSGSKASPRSDRDDR